MQRQRVNGTMGSFSNGNDEVHYQTIRVYLAEQYRVRTYYRDRDDLGARGSRLRDWASLPEGGLHHQLLQTPGRHAAQAQAAPRQVEDQFEGKPRRRQGHRGGDPEEAKSQGYQAHNGAE